MLPIKKLYVDSRMRTKGSKSSSEFAIDLPNTLLMPENTVFFVDDVTIPVSWYNINSSNNKLYVLIYSDEGAQPVHYRTALTIKTGNHNTTSLAK